jgi:hypothetical protein
LKIVTQLSATDTLNVVHLFERYCGFLTPRRDSAKTPADLENFDRLTGEAAT